MKKHILVLDDEAVIREMLVDILTANQYRVTPVATGTEAVALVQKDPPHLVISDLQLDDSDGMNVIAQIKKIVPNTPVILLTGVLFDPKVVGAILGANVTSYLEKTCPLSRVIEEVNRLVNLP